MRLKIMAAALIFLLIPALSFADRLHPKRWYQERWCAKYFDPGETTISDTYDCITDKYVIEFDFADKWYESIGESLQYAIQTGKQPGIVLIMENEEDIRYWHKLNKVIDHYDLPIKTWNTAP